MPPWEAIRMVTGGLTLVAFLAAVAALIFRQKLLADSELIRTAPENERKELVIAKYGKLFDIDTSKLTKQQSYDLAVEQIRQRANGFRTSASVVVTLGVLALVVTVVALVQNARLQETTTRLDESNKKLAEIRDSRDRLQQILDERWDPKIIRMVATLKNLLERFEADFDLAQVKDREIVRDAETTLADAERVIRRALPDDCEPENTHTRVRHIPSGIVYRLIPGGSFLMGANDAQSDPHEIPQHNVQVNKPFYLAETEVTRDQWMRVVGGPETYEGDFTPVVVTWQEANEFLVALNGGGNAGHRLPTEAEWEYACRAETQTTFHWGITVPSDLYANFGRRGKRTQPNRSSHTTQIRLVCTICTGTFGNGVWTVTMGTM